VERCIDDEIPFDLPESWTWVRLGYLVKVESGKSLTSKEMKPGKIPVYGGNGITGYHNKYLVDKETVVIGRVGYYCGSVYITEPKAWVTDNAFITTYPTGCIDRDYLVFTLRSMNLGQNNNATAQPVVSGKKIYPKLFPLPPLEEQKRIAIKLKEILPLCKIM
jgi:type I restriction enzyme S subunit